MSEQKRAASSSSGSGRSDFKLHTLGESKRGLVIPKRSNKLKDGKAKQPSTDGLTALSSTKVPDPDRVEPVLQWTSFGKTLSITKHDMASLAPKTYVNDNVVQFGIRYLLTGPRPLGDVPGPQRARWEDVTAMDSLWFSRIQDRWNATPREANWFSTVFTKNVDVFSRPYFIIPINDSQHWSIILVINPGFLLRLPSSSSSPIKTAKRSIASTPDVPARPVKRQRLSDDASASTSFTPCPPDRDSRPTPPLTLPPGTDQSQFVRWLPCRGGRPQVSLRDLCPEIHREQLLQAEEQAPVVQVRRGGPQFQDDRPTIISLDPMFACGEAHVMIVREFLKNEAALKKRPELEAAGVSWNDNVEGSRSRALRTLDVNTIFAVVPTQPNYTDCALFMLHYIRRFFSDPKAFMKIVVSEYLQGKTPGFDAVANKVWDGDQARRAREEWTRELNRLGAVWYRDKAMGDDGDGPDSDDNDIVFTEVKKAPH
ncbi:hypothetical protein CF319_g5949 [Tilletia indica]|nr:hypothetical protein CF319_g5949 [Tilletia indica]